MHILFVLSLSLAFIECALITIIELLSGLNGLDIRRLGIPSEKDYLVAYIRNSQRHGPIVNWNYYVSLSFFRSASISQGVMAR
jgi:aminoglycoside phosphotransferase (APT) family kinase protein